MNKKNIKSAFESMMFIWGEPLSAKEAGNVLGIDSDEALEIMRELAEEYEQEGRGIVIREVNGSFQLPTSSLSQRGKSKPSEASSATE